jgi:hypothetical protein
LDIRLKELEIITQSDEYKEKKEIYDFFKNNIEEYKDETIPNIEYEIKTIKDFKDRLSDNVFYQKLKDKFYCYERLDYGNVMSMNPFFLMFGEWISHKPIDKNIEIETLKKLKTILLDNGITKSNVDFKLTYLYYDPIQNDSIQLGGGHSNMTEFYKIYMALKDFDKSGEVYRNGMDINGNVKIVDDCISYSNFLKENLIFEFTIDDIVYIISDLPALKK